MERNGKQLLIASKHFAKEDRLRSEKLILEDAAWYQEEEPMEEMHDNTNEDVDAVEDEMGD